MTFKKMLPYFAKKIDLEIGEVNVTKPDMLRDMAFNEISKGLISNVVTWRINIDFNNKPHILEA